MYCKEEIITKRSISQEYDSKIILTYDILRQLTNQTHASAHALTQIGMVTVMPPAHIVLDTPYCLDIHIHLQLNSCQYF